MKPVYYFGKNNSDGQADMKNLLGGKILCTRRFKGGEKGGQGGRHVCGAEGQD